MCNRNVSKKAQLAEYTFASKKLMLLLVPNDFYLIKKNNNTTIFIRFHTVDIT